MWLDKNSAPASASVGAVPVKSPLVKVGVEDLGLAVARQRLLKSLDAERGVHDVTESPAQHRPACPVHDRHQVQKAPPDRDVGDVGRPHLVGPVDRKPAQQVEEDLVAPEPAWSCAAWDPGRQSPSCASAAARACG